MAIQPIDMNLCVGCGICQDACSVDVIRFDREKKIPVIAYEEDCMLCCMCQVRCPVKAITVTPERKFNQLLAW